MSYTVERIDIGFPDANVAADLYRPHSRSGIGVITYHGHTRKRSWMSPSAERCAERDAVVVNVDMREHGDSTGGPFEIGRCALDALRIGKYMKKAGLADRVLIHGNSIGGHISLLASVYANRTGHSDVDAYSAQQPPDSPRKYEETNYPGARLLTPPLDMLIEVALRIDPKHALPLVQKFTGPRFKGFNPERGKFQLNEAYISHLGDFRNGSHGKMTLSEHAEEMEMKPVFIAVSPNDRHVNCEDGERIRDALESHGRDVVLTHFENNFREPEDFIPVADGLMDWAEERFYGELPLEGEALGA